jgi:N-acetylmuramoyl-L-alanine amidase
MRKKLLLTLAAALLLSLLVPLTVYAEITAVPRGATRVVIDGSVRACVTRPYFEKDTAYIPLREACEAFGAEAIWDEPTLSALVRTKSGLYKPPGMLRNGKFYARADAVAVILGVNCKYVKPLKAAVISKDAGLTDEDVLSMLVSNYNYDDIYWLSRIAEAEARGDGYESKLAVANVVLNRLNHWDYPDTVEGVIFDRRYSIQFTPVANGSIYNEPSNTSLLAAMDALDGKNNVPGALFFMAPDKAKTLWISKNREAAFTVGSHTYYY